MVSWSPPHTWVRLCLGWEGLFLLPSFLPQPIEGGLGGGLEREREPQDLYLL